MVTTVGSNALHRIRVSPPGDSGTWTIAVPRVSASWTTSPVPPRPRGGRPSQMAISTSECATVARPVIT